jgi:predicted  nucleic acid-binding Zn-ribbon protein
MPHQCTDCGRVFADGSTEMLSGCPDCGGTTFQYRPEGADDAPDPPEEPPEPPDPAVEGSVARTVGNAATAVRDFVGNSPPEGSADPATEPDAGAGPDPEENAAQASARSEIVPREHLPPAPDTPASDDRAAGSDRTDPAESAEGGGNDGEPADRPDLRTLRAELNDQFESIKVLEPGQYELNLMELYDREEYIIALQEDGKYTIQVPERWTDE